MKPKIKIVCGFRKDQEYTIDAEEAHKAYYLFFHPDHRTLFGGQIAVVGKDIQRIVPDYNATMGWNEAHVLDADDYNELRQRGIDAKIQKYLNAAQEIAKHCEPSDLNQPLSALVTEKYPHLAQTTTRTSGGIKQLGALIKP